MMFIPVHQENHWSLIIINNPSKTVTYYCSLMRRTNCLEVIKDLFLSMKLSVDNWSFTQNTTYPQQNGEINCGVYLCQAVEYLSRMAPLNFSEDDMSYFREKMAVELYNNKLFS